MKSSRHINQAKAWRHVVLTMTLFVFVSQRLCAHEKLHTLWVYTGWHQLNWGAWALDSLLFKPAYIGDHIFMIDSIWDASSQTLSDELAVNGRVVRFEDAYYLNYIYDPWEPDTYGMFVRMDIVGHYSIVLLPKKRGEVELYRARLMHFPMFNMIGSLFAPIGKGQKTFQDAHGYEYEILIFDPKRAPGNQGHVKGPPNHKLRYADLAAIAQPHMHEINRSKPFTEYTVEDIFDLLIQLNRMRGNSLYEGNIDYLEHF